nr:hypothetical protein [Endozoicomonas sp.]
TTVALLNPVSLVVVGAYLTMNGVIDSVAAYYEIKMTGKSSVEDESKNILRDIRHECRAMHDWLYDEKKS